jgi:hypothetical protein
MESMMNGDPTLRLVYFEALNEIYFAGGEIPLDLAILEDLLGLPAAEIDRCLPKLLEIGAYWERHGLREEERPDGSRVLVNGAASQYFRELRSGFVYLMTDGQLFKIGLSAKPRKRRSQVAQNRGRPVELLLTIPVEDMREVESFYHSRYANVRREGEWFALEPWMLEELRVAAERSAN